MKTRTRWLVGILLTLSLLVCGLLAGTWLGGRYFVPPGSGLAGPAIALSYGLLGAVVGVALGIVVSIFTPGRWLAYATIPVALAGGIVVLMVARSYMISSAETEARLQEAYDKLPAFTLTIELPETAADRPFARFAADWSARSYDVTVAGDDPQTCSAAMAGPDAVRLLTALRNIEGRLMNEPDPCAASPGAVDHHLAFAIKEARPPDSEGSLEITEACLTRAPDLAAPRDAVTEMIAENGLPDACK